jgi:hypothetical protein
LHSYRLYFHRGLSREELLLPDHRSLVSRMEADLLGSLAGLLEKSEASFVSLLCDATSLAGAVGNSDPGLAAASLTGYIMPVAGEGDGASGLGLWPPLVTVPADASSKEHWPNIVSLIMDNASFFSSRQEPLRLTDKSLSCVYLLAQVDNAVYLAVVMAHDPKRPKTKQEQAAASSMQLLTQQLTCQFHIKALQRQ